MDLNTRDERDEFREMLEVMIMGYEGILDDLSRPLAEIALSLSDNEHPNLSAAYLRAWWSLRRCETISEDLKLGKDLEALRKDIPTSASAMADYSVWFGWIQAVRNLPNAESTQ